MTQNTEQKVRTDTDRLEWLNRSYVEVNRYDRYENKIEIVDDDGNILSAGNHIRSCLDAAMDAEESPS